MAEEKLLLASAASALGVEAGATEASAVAAADPVSAAVVSSLDAKLESIDDLIARLEIEEGEVGGACDFECTFSSRLNRRWCIP